MNHVVKASLFAAALSLVAIGTLSACTGTVSSGIVEYRVTTSADRIGTVSYHTVQLGAGSVDFEDAVRKKIWSKKVDGGWSPSVSATAPSHGTVSCEIIDADGKVLAHEEGRNGASADCQAGDTE
ncbi:hypothetical protein [Curtobacterium flaccumfaciens]|uniref:hypothetical protein n=1 Tax=Curtobacterium flaccumfaciens TaxID=2035 RepID=UPI001266D2B5|nr:hypothetical protein [Curtobacterium flaccumfaciens]MBT1664944.1 hypothetical protein [Curtobacterium flaccumfaciens pv. flaccumfaciens]QFS79411.1 hypothetical protein GBG65_07955 [Curtobacterium flaccumfaciens pv. flaccumfaciens]